jgi:hypothetical protein
MASGHVYRTNRPNTWLLRPILNVKILLANPAPSTLTSVALVAMSVFSSGADQD